MSLAELSFDRKQYWLTHRDLECVPFYRPELSALCEGGGRTWLHSVSVSFSFYVTDNTSSGGSTSGVNGQLDDFERADEALRGGDLAEASLILESMIEANSSDTTVLCFLASVRLAENRVFDAKALFESAAYINPDLLQARLGLFDIAIRQERFADALDQFTLLPAEIRKEFDLLAHQANLLGKVGRHEEELILYDALIEMRPGLPGLLVSKANTLRTLGRRQEAISQLRHVIETHPDYARSWWLLSDLKDFRFGEADISTMTTLLDRTTVPAGRVPLHFALAKAFEDKGDTKAAFEHYAAGNNLQAANVDHDIPAIRTKVDRTIKIFSSDFLARHKGWGHNSNAPIFIIGLQRSGSTLIEQILASHPLIEGTSELPIMPQVLQFIYEEAGVPRASPLDQLSRLDGDRLNQLGQLYLDRAATYRRSDLPYFTDKLPLNWSNIGIIRLILPNATIIDARRHPMAVGFSNYKQHYDAGSFYTNRLETIGRYYREYLRLMTYFEQVDPGSMYRAVNESLIKDFEPQVRLLLNHIGVRFDGACLDFHRNKRAVATPSAEQVRRPISREGVDQWRAFKPWLRELERALGPALDGWNLPPGTYRE